MCLLYDKPRATGDWGSEVTMPVPFFFSAAAMHAETNNCCSCFCLISGEMGLGDVQISFLGRAVGMTKCYHMNNVHVPDLRVHICPMSPSIGTGHRVEPVLRTPYENIGCTDSWSAGSSVTPKCKMCRHLRRPR